MSRAHATRWVLSALLVGIFCVSQGLAATSIFEDRAAWEAAIRRMGPTAILGIEEFTGADSHGNDVDDGNGLDKGPHSFAFGSLTLGAIGNGVGDGIEDFGGSSSGIRDNTLEIRLVAKSSDFELFPNSDIFIEGEGAELATFDFKPGTFAFSLDVSNIDDSEGNRSHDGVDLRVNGRTINLEKSTSESGGFIGILDTDGISGFTLVTGQRDPNNFFQEIRIDELKFAAPPKPEFRRGDSNASGEVDISDPISTLGVLFLGVGEITCRDAADSNDDGEVDISDAINTLGVLFLGTGFIPPPGMTRCGVDPTGDRLTCETFRRCP